MNSRRRITSTTTSSASSPRSPTSVSSFAWPTEWRRSRTSPRSRAKGRRNSIERSEEHTSELQSHSDLVCRLLLEKKKKKNKTKKKKIKKNKKERAHHRE